MRIELDVREQDLSEIVRTVNTMQGMHKIEMKALPIGDIILYDKEDNERIIIERKSLYDLAASIKDGRYKEQSFRLSNSNVPNHNIIYLIEGDWSKYNEKKGRMDKEALLSACTTLNHYKGFSVWKTTSLNESAHWLIQLCNKMDKMDISCKPYYNVGDITTVSDKTYVDVATVQREKKKNIDETNICVFMLACIPGVSTKTAQCILDKKGSLKQLIQALELDPECLKDMCIQSANGKDRKISKTVIKSIVDYLSL